MTTAHTIPDTLQQTQTDVSLSLQWTGMCNRWTMPSVLTEQPLRTHEILTLNLILHVHGNHASIEAWLEHVNGRQTIVQEKKIIACEVNQRSGYLHIDIADAEQTLLRVTLDEHHELVYAQSALLQNKQFTAGLFDRPVLTDLNIRDT